jgi:hypothetical protein
MAGLTKIKIKAFQIWVNAQHRCFYCSKKFYALCSSVRHPKADFLGLGCGNAILCPACAGILSENLQQAAMPNPISVNNSVSSEVESVDTPPSTNEILTLAERAAQHSQHHVIEDGNATQKKQLFHLHPLPPGVTVNNNTASDELKCQFTKQYSRKLQSIYWWCWWGNKAYSGRRNVN